MQVRTNKVRVRQVKLMCVCLCACVCVGGCLGAHSLLRIDSTSAVEQVMGNRMATGRLGGLGVGRTELGVTGHATLSTYI